ncbi:DUF502 domain-containing protein [Microvirga solisilvae]|uniref:DUF502 domain-containing protein n=1 Tax=Microvirga solisilvae TaxID=2919498 RepID=UPI001FAEFAE1|nr:DUF502 domain-containing protein [Microvirga solisilvae]
MDTLIAGLTIVGLILAYFIGKALLYSIGAFVWGIVENIPIVSWLYQHRWWATFFIIIACMWADSSAEVAGISVAAFWISAFGVPQREDSREYSESSGVYETDTTSSARDYDREYQERRDNERRERDRKQADRDRELADRRRDMEAESRRRQDEARQAAALKEANTPKTYEVRYHWAMDRHTSRTRYVRALNEALAIVQFNEEISRSTLERDKSPVVIGVRRNG